MTWGAQVAHVARKDLLHARWSLLAYCAAISFVAFSIVHWPSSGSGFWTVLLIPLVMIIAASIVQADSPSRVDAFWATSPLSPSAVAAAKLVVAGVGIILPGLIAQFIAIQAFDIPLDTIPELLWNSALGQAGLLLIAMAIAALTRDLRAFIVVLVVYFVALQLTPVLVPWSQKSPVELGAAAFLVVSLLSPLAITAVLFYQYRSRNLRLGRILGIVVGVLLTVAFPSMTRSSADAAPASRGITAAHAVVERRGNPQSVQLFVDIPGKKPGERAVMSDMRVTMIGTRSHTDSLSNIPSFSIISQPQLKIGRDATWLGHPESPSDSTAFGFNIAAAKLDAVLDGRAKLVLQGLVSVESQHADITLPLDSGATASANGTRFIYNGMGEGSNGRELNVALFTLSRASNDRNPFNEQRARYRFVLVNDAHNEALELAEGSTGGGTVMPPMPGVLLYLLSMKLRVDSDRFGQKISVDDAWLRGAHLVVVVWRAHLGERVALNS